MAEIANGCEFEYDGINSSELSLAIIHEDGLFERQFGENRKINTEKIRGLDVPYYFDKEREVLSGTIRIYSEAPWTLKQERAVSEFLFKDRFCEFISEDNPDLIYMLMFTGECSIVTGADDEGYIECEFVCDAPWAWSKPFIQSYALTYGELIEGFRFDVDNICNIPSYNALEIEIEFADNLHRPMTMVFSSYNPSSETIKVKTLFLDSCEIHIQNESVQDENEALIIKDTNAHPLLVSEKVYMDMNTENLVSNKDLYRRSTIKNLPIPLRRGKNTLVISIGGEYTIVNGVVKPLLGTPAKYDNIKSSDIALTLNTRCRFPINR